MRPSRRYSNAVISSCRSIARIARTYAVSIVALVLSSAVRPGVRQRSFLSDRAPRRLLFKMLTIMPVFGRKNALLSPIVVVEPLQLLSDIAPAHG